jgi:type II secretory pathway component PulK
VAFIVTLWLVVALAAMTLAAAGGTRTRNYQVAAHCAAARARSAEQGALRYVLRCLTDSAGLQPEATETAFCAAPVGEGLFWLLQGDVDQDGEMDFGLVREGGKIDLNTAPADLLASLAEMTDERAAAVVDWRDDDDETTPGGAESDYYLRRPEPHEAKNAPFETVGELRLVAGIDDALLWGEDLNRNGLLDAGENDGAATAPDDDRDGQLDPGLAGLVSPWVRWPDAGGGQGAGGGTSQKTDVNSASRSDIQDALETVLDEDRATEVAAQLVPRRPLASLLHVHDAGQLTVEEFAKVETVLEAFPPGVQTRLDVNAAPAGVLSALPGLEDDDAAALVSARAAGDASGTSIAWMIDAIYRGKLLAAAATVGIVGRSYQYVADVLALSGDGRAFRRARYVIDVADGSPKVVHRADLTHLGWPIDPDIRRRLRLAEITPEQLAEELQANQTP